MERSNHAAHEDDAYAQRMLAHYDAHRRDLPWRYAPFEKADPYRVWLSEIMLQQTVVATVIPYFEDFTTRWPHVQALAAARDEDVMRRWAGLGYYARARNLLACARQVVSEYGGVFPDSEDELRKLKGIGSYTAAAIAAIAFQKRAIVIDGNIERVVARLQALQMPFPTAKSSVAAFLARISPEARCGDFAQSLMDLGALICKPRNPDCTHCPLQKLCRAAHMGIAEKLPIKAVKLEKPQRHCEAFVIFDPQGRLLVRQRPPHGLFGGMIEVPNNLFNSENMPLGIAWPALSAQVIEKTAAMSHAFAPILPRALPDELAQLFKGANLPWRKPSKAVRHIFTHFALDVDVYIYQTTHAITAPESYFWLDDTEIESEAFPSLMRKIIAQAKKLGVSYV